MLKKYLLLLVLLMLFNLDSYAQTDGIRTKGPIIHDFGAIFSVSNPDFQTDTNLVYKVVFDIHNSPEDPAKLNPSINTLARFLNMHAQAGVPLKNLQIAGIFHNKATKDAMNSALYKEKYGIDNPNEQLLQALEEAGVDLYICGQSIAARGYKRHNLSPPIKVGLSAMTIILNLKEKGYTLIKF